MLRQFRPYAYKEKYWLPIHNKKVTSIGLNFTLLMLSKPHVREHMGLVLCSSQMSTCWPQVAKTASLQWWSIPVYTVCKVEKRKSLQNQMYKCFLIITCYTAMLLFVHITENQVTVPAGNWVLLGVPLYKRLTFWALSVYKTEMHAFTASFQWMGISHAL